MDWKTRIRSAFADARVMPDEDVIEELAQHAAATYDAARAEGEDRDGAERCVERQMALWVHDAPSLTPRTRRPAAVQPPRADSASWTGVTQDVRYALRLWRRAPGAAALAVTTIALGIGATTALFSLTWGVLMKPLPWPNADRIVQLSETRGGNPPRFGSFSNAAYVAWSAEQQTIEALGAWSQRTVTVTADGEPERLPVISASPSVFTVLGARPLIGSLFDEHDERASVVVLSESLWRERFGADHAALGRAVRLDGEPFTIVGVLPDGSAYPNRRARAWVPLRVPAPDGDSISMFEAVALLRPGVTPAQAAAEGTSRGRFIADSGLTATAIFGSAGPVAVSTQPLRDALTADVRRPLLVLLAAVGLLLVTATGNVASLQLARATTRRREMAIRAAIGAGTRRLVRQLLIESVLLGIGGGAAGLGLACLLHRGLRALLPLDFPRADDVRVTLAVVAFATAASALTSIVIGVLPAAGMRRLNLTEVLAEDGTAPVIGGGSARTARARALITAAQVAVACVLLIGASLLGRSFVALLQADRGYDPSNVLTARISMPAPRYSPARRHAVVEQILDRVAAMPDVAAAAFTSELPLTPGGSTAAFTLRSRAVDAGTVAVQASPRIVSPRSFTALGLRLIAGRGFTEADTDTAPAVAIVNRTFARRYTGAALGARVPLGVGYGIENVEATIVGIVDDVRYPATAETAHPEIYYSFRQMRGELLVPGVTLLLRTHGDPRSLAAALRGAVREADPTLAHDSVSTLADRVLTGLARPRLYAVVLGGFAVLAVAIAGVGLFGVLSYTVAQRARELAIRAALGASPSTIVALVVGQGLVVTVIGAAVGLGVAFALVRSLATFLYGVTARDPMTFAGVPLLLIAVGVLACVVPARRAARIDPLRVLRAG